MRIIPSQNNFLTADRKYTFLNAGASASSTTLTVASIVGFATDQLLLVGEIGSEKAEIVQTHASTSPSGSTVTLASGLSFDHPAGTRVYIIDWDKVEIHWSLTEDGSKTLLDTIDIQVDQVETVYEDTSKVEGYYFIRFKNSVTDSYSDYSDAIPWEGFDDNTVSKAINYALKRNKLKTFTDFIDYDFCIEEINNCLRYIRGKKKKWTHLQDFNRELGQTARGEFSIALPTDVWRKSHKSILSVRIGDNKELSYKDKKDFDKLLVGVTRTTLSVGASAGDTEIYLTNAYDFDDDGSVMIAGQVIDYDDKDDSTGKLSGIPTSGTGSITADIVAGTNVWQGSYKEGTPLYYTVYDGYLYWWPLTGSSKPIMNIVADFWTEASEVESDGDTLDIYRFEMVKLWLTWAIRAQLKNDGIRDYNDADYMKMREILMDAIKQDVHGQRYKTTPRLNKINY